MQFHSYLVYIINNTEVWLCVLQYIHSRIKFPIPCRQKPRQFCSSFLCLCQSVSLSLSAFLWLCTDNYLFNAMTCLIYAEETLPWTCGFHLSWFETHLSILPSNLKVRFCIIYPKKTTKNANFFKQVLFLKCPLWYQFRHDSMWNVLS